MVNKQGTTRRAFLRNAGLGASAALLAATGLPAALTGRARRAQAAVTGSPAPGRPGAGSSPEVELLVGDVLGFALESDEWEGDFGWVKFRLHEGFFNGERAYFIRTDTSNPDFAEENRLVWVPLLAAALGDPQANRPLYLFPNGAEGQLPVLSTVPGQDDYTPAFSVHNVTFSGEARLLTSAAEVAEAQEAGEVTVEPLNIVVNYPLVKWPGGELTEDTEKREYLGTGPLIAPVDTGRMEVTFKLHQCFPGSRYIVTDTSAVPMAPMMSIAPSPASQLLADLGATDEIWVFGNGIAGSGVMGFQPAVFDNRAGDPTWSPFWNHFTITWSEDASPRILRTSAEIRAAEEAGEIQVWNGTPDTHPDGFVVNCPVPILARNTFGEEEAG